MADYIDGFVHPIPRKQLSEYKAAAEQIAKIWREHGALAYYEYVGDDLNMQGVKSFSESTNAKEDEAILFGWVVFPTREVRDQAVAKVAADKRMSDLVDPITDPSNLVFDAKRMAYGGFKQLIKNKG